MLNTILNGGDPRDWLIQLLLSLPVIFLALSFHETAHGYVAYRLGDPTARQMGRLTLNPLKHVDILGFICMLLVGFGWAKPVPVNTRYFKKPRRDMALTGAAGPISNLLLALVFALLMKVAYILLDFISIPNDFWAAMFLYLLQFLFIGIRLNVAFAIFNLLPIPPFDGSRIVFSLLPAELYFKIMKYEQIIYIILLVALFVGVLDPVLNLLTNLVMDLIFNAVLL